MVRPAVAAPARSVGCCRAVQLLERCCAVTLAQHFFGGAHLPQTPVDGVPTSWFTTAAAARARARAACGRLALPRCAHRTAPRHAHTPDHLRARAVCLADAFPASGAVCGAAEPFRVRSSSTTLLCWTISRDLEISRASQRMLARAKKRIARAVLIARACF